MLHLQTPPSSVKEENQKCEPLLKGQGHEFNYVLKSLLSAFTINALVTI